MIAPTAAINPGPVFSAGKAASITEAQTALPSMRGTLAGWFKPMIVAVITTTIAAEGERAGQSEDISREVRTSGLLQPGTAEKLDLKAEGERSWQNWLLHVYPQLDVQTDARIRINGTSFRVMARTDYIANGFIRYELLEDYS